jgi:uncharacterized protein (UPF0548 family)
VIRLRPPSDELLQRILDEQGASPFPYPAVGATAGRADSPALPEGFHHDHLATDLGPDDGDRFHRAQEALRQWAPQRGAGIRVYPGRPVAEGEPFVLALPLPGVGWALAPGRVAYVLDEPDRAGFGYGTLPGHPERGEEAFLVVRAQGRLRFEVIAFSRPHDLLVRLGRPVSRALQMRTIRSYLGAMEAATR